MEIAVIQNYRAKLACVTSPNYQVIIKNKPQLWIALKVTLHLNNSVN
jgi:hypothetical protein